jgi:pimeloyl-ACP methyl ester carboxylesterase
MREEVVEGTVFRHVVFASGPPALRTLHVYLDGDGTPWSFWAPSADPTPRNPLVLRLMALDPAPSLYLGRPCYHGLSEEPPCAKALWTNARYSEAVVSSMASALRRTLAGTGIERLVWFGHSGGGALAMLLAPRFEETTDVVTVAANLDTDAWADLHGYARLDGSLNPARQPPLPARIRQRHYVGGKDSIVPREVVARGTIDARWVIVIPDYSHACCWEAMWPSLAADVDRAGSSP